MSIDWTTAPNARLRLTRVRKPEPGIEFDLGSFVFRLTDMQVQETFVKAMAMIAPRPADGAPISDVAAAALATAKAYPESVPSIPEIGIKNDVEA